MGGHDGPKYAANDPLVHLNNFDLTESPNRYYLGIEDMGAIGLPYPGNSNIIGLNTEDHPYLPRFNPSYHFDNSDLDRLISINLIREVEREDSASRKGILIAGPSGGGKSSYIAQRHAYQGLPLIEVTARADMDAADLLYTREIVGGNTQVAYGMGIIAALNGIPLLINEINNLKPSTLLALNDFIEYGRVTIPETGEVIEAKRGFVVHATCNGLFTDDPTGQHAGTRAQNVSLLRRFHVFRMGYPTLEQEKAYIRRMHPEFDDATATAYAKFTELMHRASDLEAGGQVVSGRSIKLSRPFNRANLTDWLELTTQAEYLRQSGQDPAWWALGPTYYGLMPDAERQAVSDIYKLAFKGA